MNTPRPTDSQFAWFAEVARELRAIAERALSKERPGHSLQPTLLVNDAYFRLLKQRNVDRGNRNRVLAVGARIIRRRLVEYGRNRRRRVEQAPGATSETLMVSVAGSGEDFDIVDLNDALVALKKLHRRSAQVVELKYFGGLRNKEIAELLGVTRGTVHTDWRFAKAFLYDALKG
ncbi:ECF-type sigma factor [Planctomyces sp. SH-PL14]|jgi:RNA polymerase sigma factor (TIGR02999 family)|uniref:ECF-type sigma factor n=1 Tax=Planctomyces sp. SH-PL14 TaxID=1632864 RepID=UPI00078DB0B9|nr:ECF-type sigma factor [Planctomyces sp. SH-PL14]AMV21151.1 RNA polymerase sigma factor [Planctomyces sp. SH-PL14]